jgi:4-hydroxybenzoate polyprenyltransferase
LQLFDHVIGSDAQSNRRGEAKVAAIRERVGEVFDYMGDSDADLPLVEACRQFHPVAASRRLTAAVDTAGKAGRVFAADAAAGGWKAKLKLIRPHQWAKNALIFVPMIMAHQFDLVTFGWALLGMVAFCCAASSIYIFNDLVDIDSDRRHKTKRRRPLAAATVSVPTALKMGVVLLVLGLAAGGLAAMGPGGLAFPGWVLLYLVLTTIYSFSLKRRLLVDVILLGWLYTHRVLAGGIVTGIEVSQWLLAFSTFLFISLAFAKRYTELHHAPPGKSNKRRGYRAEDLPLIGNIGPTSGFMALLVFCLYLNDLQVDPVRVELYQQPWVLWLIVPIMMFWILRVWFLAFRGELHDDPIVFAIRDKISYACFFAGAALLLIATY